MANKKIKSSNTGDKQEKPAKKPGTFVKDDPRINKNGRPKGFDQLRDLALKLCEEIKTNPKTGETMRAVEIILRQMMADPKQRKDFLEIAYGKVPLAVQVSGDDGGPLEVLIRREMIGANAKADAPD
jgi:hypothetical protein